MENQPRQITGYRELTDWEIFGVNPVKELALEVGVLVDSLAQDADMDQRWVAIARTQLQQGFMALTRAITKPTTF